MSGRVVPISRGRAQKIAIVQLQYSPTEVWLTACECGRSSKHGSRDDARGARRAHQRSHDRAEAAHPAGKGRPGGDAS